MIPQDRKREARIATLFCLALIGGGAIMGLIWTILNRPAV
jgi:hypothetical protein